MHFGHHTLLLFGLGAAIALSAPPVEAYCIRSLEFEDAWQVSFQDLRIPVWLNVSDFGLHHAGLSNDDAVPLLQEVIARHNEAGVGPKLYYAGVTASNWKFGEKPQYEALPAGITVMSRSCSEMSPCHDDAQACANFANYNGS